MSGPDRRLLAIVLAVLGLTAILVVGIAIALDRRTIPAIPAPSTSTTCVEDMPCWDCTTMGNRICGPTR
jgi:hypothetical protein